MDEWKNRMIHVILSTGHIISTNWIKLLQIVVQWNKTPVDFADTGPPFESYKYHNQKGTAHVDHVPIRKKQLEIQKAKPAVANRCKWWFHVESGTKATTGESQNIAIAEPLQHDARIWHDICNVYKYTVNQFKPLHVDGFARVRSLLSADWSLLQCVQVLSSWTCSPNITKYHFALRFDDTLSCTSHLNLHAFCPLQRRTLWGLPQTIAYLWLLLNKAAISSSICGKRFRRDIVDPCPCIFSDLWDRDDRQPAAEREDRVLLTAGHFTFAAPGVCQSQVLSPPLSWTHHRPRISIGFLKVAKESVASGPGFAGTFRNQMWQV